MSAFVGFNVDETTRQNKNIMVEMLNEINYNTSNNTSSYLDDDIAIGMCGADNLQTITNEDESMVLAFDGEIYNYEEIKYELCLKDHVFKTENHQEVLLHGYEQWGSSLLSRLNGVFSFVIWDKEQKEVFGARDSFGVKPFYYAKIGSTVMFSSGIKSFLNHPNFRKEFNYRALENYLSFGYSPAPECFYKNVFKLSPAHYFRFKDKQMQIKSYSVSKFIKDDTRDLNYWLEKTGKTIEKCIENKEFYNDDIPSLNTNYTIDEIFLNSLEKAFKYMDEPVNDTSIVPLYETFKELSKKSNTCITNLGADELFAGYDYFIPKKKGLFSKSKDDVTFLENNILFSDKDRKKLILHTNKAQLPEEMLLPYFNFLKDSDSITKMQFATISTSFVCNKLFIYDKISRANSITLRNPFLDREMMKFAQTIPSKYIVYQNEPKYLLNHQKNKISEQEIKDITLDILNKYFEIIKQELLSNVSKEFFDESAILKLIKEQETSKKDNSKKLWTIYCFVIWYKSNFNSEARGAKSPTSK